MSYQPASPWQFSLPMVPVVGVQGLSAGLYTGTGAPGSAAWSSANRAVYMGFRVPAPVLVKRLWVAVGATGGTNTWDLGIYTDGGVQIVHMGSTTAGTANTIQFMDITDTLLMPGSYYMAMSSSGTTATVLKWTLAGSGSAMFTLQQATAHPLPATATFATSVNFPFVMGYCTTASP